uniref:Elongation of very long chain fatty acids protein n=1 Tax=Lutzomyia longipalpis TaxID=7200 RepID=A0A1B0CF34_LUTLO
MIYLITDMYDWYRDLMDNKSDPRVQDWPLMSSPLPTMAICLFYAYFSKVMGPRIMANRKPMNLRNILVVYNLIQTIFSAWIFYEYLQSGWWGHYSLKCQPVDYSRSPMAMRMANTCWWYFLAKFTEFFDTLFFILRHKMEHVSTLHVIHHGCMPFSYLQSGWWGHYSLKCQPVDYSRSPMAMRMANTCWWYFLAKFTEFFDTLFFILRHKMEHVSTLHVIHHGCMPFSVWMGMKFAPGGHSTFFAMLNSFVHIVMYFYYMVAAMGPRYQKYIWWKKYLTTFQMVQFVAIFIHQFQLLFRDCDYPKGFMVWIGLHGVMFLFLFSDFYKAKYSRPSKGKLSARDSKADHATQNGKIHTNGNQGACMRD